MKCNQRTTWEHHAKERKTATATYVRTAQALTTSIRDEAELEEGLAMNCRNMRREKHRLLLYQTRGQRKIVKDSDEDGEPKIFFQDQDLSDRTAEDVERFFGSFRFARNPQEFK